MIKVYETKEEKKAAFKRSVGLRKVWEDLTSGKMGERYSGKIFPQKKSGMVLVIHFKHMKSLVTR